VSNQKIHRLRFQLFVLAIVRLFINTGLRMVYPFAPALARGLGIELTAVYNLVTLRNFTGFLSPLFGPWSERFGRKPIMIGSMLLFTTGCALLIFWQSFWILGVVLALIALSKVIFDPAMQAYVGDTVPYGKRGLAFAMTELSWAGALLIGAPFIGFVIQRKQWQTAFLWLAIFGLLSALLLWFFIPRPRKRISQNHNFRSLINIIRNHPIIWAASAYSLMVMAANETFFIVYGDWMESSFNLQLSSLGLASGIIGGAEIFGELFVGWSVDRFGKRPVIITTGLLTALCYSIIPYGSSTLFSALSIMFLLFLFFEITVVGAVPLLSEVVPSARSAVMAMVLAAGALGRALGDIIGPRIWDKGGLVGNGITAAIIMTLAILILANRVREMPLDGVNS